MTETTETKTEFKGCKYIRGKYGISVSHVDGFGKYPGLWIYKDNVCVKMASFGSFEKAEMFMRYLDYMMLINGKEPDTEEGKAND